MENKKKIRIYQINVKIGKKRIQQFKPWANRKKQNIKKKEFLS